LSCKVKIRRKKPSWIRTRLGFYLPTLYVVDLESNPETQPSHIKGWEGDPRTSLDTFATIHLSARNLESSPLFGYIQSTPSLYTSIVVTPSIKSDKQDVGRYPTRELNLGKTCVFLRRLIAVEFAGSHRLSISRKPSSMGIAGVEPRQLFLL
jgi:hypothetical protein